MNTWKTCAALLRQGRQTALFRDLAGGVVMTEEQAAQSARYAPLLDACPAFRDLETVPGLFRQVRVDPGGYGVSWTGDLDLSAEEIYVNGQPRG